MSNITFFGDLLKNDQFIERFGIAMAANGGVRVGFQGAYFDINGDRYVYKTYTVSLPRDMISIDSQIVDVFLGLLEREFFVVSVHGYVALRSAEAIEKDGRVYFYIRAVQV